MATIETILEDLKASRFSEALNQATVQAAQELQSHRAKQVRFKEPGFYPYLRLLQAYALTGLERQDEAYALISEEIARQRPGHMRTDFIVSHYVVLGAVLANQKEGTIAASMAKFEELLNKAALTFAQEKGTRVRNWRSLLNIGLQDGNLGYLRADLHDSIINEFDIPLIHRIAQLSVPGLVQRLGKKSYYFVTPASNGDYSMPKPSEKPFQPLLVRHIGAFT